MDASEEGTYLDQSGSQRNEKKKEHRTRFAGATRPSIIKIRVLSTRKRCRNGWRTTDPDYYPPGLFMLDGIYDGGDISHYASRGGAVVSWIGRPKKRSR